jgi:hypothetical protein
MILIQGVASRWSCREKSQESQKNKIKNVGEGGGLKVQTFHHVFFKLTFILKYDEDDYVKY